MYREMAEPLEQVVRRLVCDAEPVVEDACQSAWTRLVVHSGRVSSESALSWLATTAVREAVKLLRRDDRELSLEVSFDSASAPPSPAPGPDELFEHRERLGALARLPPRQRQMLWLQGAGLSYTEIAAATGASTRTVERQLLRAKRTLREP